jgi:glycosyltransferase involved in cell wall biosynthesis
MARSPREVIISFVVPAYNEEVLIRSCLQSILAEAQRTQISHEIIVVDNASTDRTAHIAGEFPDVTIINEPKTGLVYSRMTGHLVH